MSAITAFLRGLLPDSRDVLDRWAGHFGVSADNPFALLEHVGEDCAGAAQFVRPDRVEHLEPGKITWLRTSDLQTRIEGLRADPTAWLGVEDNAGQFSLAGAQAKFAVYRAGKRWGDPCGVIPTTLIVKPTAGRFADQHINEHLCLRTASRVGLLASSSELVDFGREQAVVVERYDRRQLDNGTWTRIHQEDFCQALSVMPERKYQSEGGPGAADMFRLLRILLPGEDGDYAVKQLIDALAFNWLIGGTDAHAKNFSLLMSGPTVRLAPLYDLASILPYRLPSGERPGPGRISRDPRLAMKIGENYELAMIRRIDWVSVCDRAGVDSATTLDRIEQIAEILPAAVAEVVSAAEVKIAGSDLPGRLVEGVEKNVGRCTSALVGRPARSRPGRR
jgi:serine/threonine-protein kinase HipA